MAKKVKMVIYGKPGEGKSTFASKSPNPLFICTDGNFEWLDLPDQNHRRVSTWKEAKQVINDIVLGKAEYLDYKTIVVDLLEDLYIWAEDEFCKREGIIHVSDYKSMGAGYSVVRKEFFAQISKLLSIDKNIILISHEADKVGKTKAGADTYTYIPSDKLSLSKQWNDIEGQVRYFLRCYSQEEEFEGRTIKKRYLSLVPGSNEYGIARGLDEANAPREIELDWNVFTSVIGLDNQPEEKPVTVSTPKPEKTVKVTLPKESKPKEEVKKVTKVEPVKAEESSEDFGTNVFDEIASVVEVEEAPQSPTVEKTVEVQVEPQTIMDAKPEPVKQPVNTSNLTAEERRRLVMERMKAMKERR